MKYIKLTIILTAAAIFAIACGQTATTSNTANKTANNAAPVNTPSTTSVATPPTTTGNDETAAAKELYITNCAQCHKDNGKGGKVTVDGKSMEPDDITTAKMAGKTDEKLTEYIVNGFPDDGMPAFKNKLTPDQIKAIVNHIRTLQKDPIALLFAIPRIAN